MNFLELPLIPAQNVYREAKVSIGKGERELARLVEQGAVKPLRTPTGRVLLSANDGRIVFERLTAAA